MADEATLVNAEPAAPAATTPPAKEPPATPPPAKADAPPAEPEATLLTEETKEETQVEPKGTNPPAEPLALKPPVGVNPDDPGFKSFQKFAKEKKLSAEQAQGAMDLYAEALQKQESKMRSAFAEQKSAWAKQAQTDKEFGGEKLASSLNLAKRAIDKYGSPGLRTMLDQSGLGNHPEVIRFFTRIGKTLAEDSFAGALGNRTPPAQAKTPEQKLREKYPSMFPKTEE